MRASILAIPSVALLGLLSPVAGCTKSSGDTSSVSTPVTSGAPADWFKRTGGGYIYYLQESNRTFAQITADIRDHLGPAGYGFVLLYVPYHGDVDAYSGLGPIDYYSGGPAGSIAELEDLVNVAHAQKMAVWTWANLGYSTVGSPWFQKALADRKAGRHSVEADSISWIGTTSNPTQYWDHPAFDWASSAWQAEATKIVDFWLDRGMSGFVLDAWGQGVGQNAGNQAALEERIHRRGNTVIVRESGDYDFDFDGNLVDVLTGEADADATALAPTHYTSAEHLLEPSLDEDASPAHYRVPSPALQVQLAIEMMNCMTPIDDLNGYPRLSEDVQREIDRIVGAVNTNRALNLDASRTRAATDDQRTCYVEERAAADSSQKALAVFNLSASAHTCTITTTAVSGATKDLLTGASGPAIAGGRVVVSLPKFGYRLFEIR
jgi:hypothetical protein